MMKKRALYTTRSPGSDMIRFFPSKPKYCPEEEQFYRLRRSSFDGDMYRDYDGLTSECVKLLRRYTGLNLKPGECRKVYVSIEPAE